VELRYKGLARRPRKWRGKETGVTYKFWRDKRRGYVDVRDVDGLINPPLPEYMNPEPLFEVIDDSNQDDKARQT